jgi:hypothetical protein
MAKANLTAHEVAMIMRMISVFISFNKMVKDIDHDALLEVLKKLDSPERSDKEIIRSSEDHHDLTDVIGYQKCEDCND